ncbi:MAG: ABC transporter substrate-binding protein [Nocardioidaceae bacterium]|nr:ABC transporter substrate-binding protein [Nocardioidaceae bacterium]
MKIKHIVALAILTVTALAVTACGGSGGKAGKNSEGLTTLRLNYPPSISIAALHIAEDNGLFAKEGLKIETKQNLTSGAAAEAVMGGQVDLAWNNVAGAATAYGAHIPLRLVAITDYQVPGNMQVLVGKDSKITDVAGLRGHSVAVLAPNTTCVLAIKSALAAKGLKSDTVTFQVVPPGDHPTVLSSGKVDAVCTIEPIRAQMIAELGAKPVFDVADSSLGQFPVGGFITSASFADKNAKALDGFVKALAEASKMALDDPSLALKVLEKHGELKPEYADKITLTRYATNLKDVAAVQSLADHLLEFGAVQAPVDVDGFFGTK